MELQAAKKNDVYAFGLIAIYVLFMENTGKDELGLEVMENTVWDFYLRHEILHRVKLPSWIGLMKSIPEEGQRVALQDFFRSTLSVRPEQRESRIGNLIHSLNIARYDETPRICQGLVLTMIRNNTCHLPKLFARDLGTRWENISHLNFRVSLFHDLVTTA